MASAKRLEGKTAIITGAAGGLGKAIAKGFLEAGAQVVLCDISDQVTATTEELSSLGTAHAIKADIAKDGAADAIFEEAAGKVGKVDILVNNAGIMDHFEPVGDQDIELYDQLMSINLRAPMLLSKAAVNHMLKQEPVNGSILNVVSLAALKGMVSGAAYTASKHGLLGLSKHTAAYYGRKGIRCNAIMPGGMMTNIANTAYPKFHKEGYELTQTHGGNKNMQMCDLDQMAKLVVYACSEDANPLLNGALISADRGMAAF